MPVRELHDSGWPGYHLWWAPFFVSPSQYGIHILHRRIDEALGEPDEGPDPYGLQQACEAE